MLDKAVVDGFLIIKPLKKEVEKESKIEEVGEEGRGRENVMIYFF